MSSMRAAMTIGFKHAGNKADLLAALFVAATLPLHLEAFHTRVAIVVNLWSDDLERPRTRRAALRFHPPPRMMARAPPGPR